MATLTTTPIKVFVSGETVTPTKLNELSQSTVALTAGTIVAADIASDAVTNVKIASGVDASKLTTGTLPADRIGSSAITTARINDAAVTAVKLNGVAKDGSGVDVAVGTAPIFGCRAWVNFDGTAGDTIGGEFRCTIRSSGNVSKVIRNSTGNYTVHFTTAMPDTNYAAVMYNNATSGSTVLSFNNGFHGGMGDKTTTTMGLASYTWNPSNAYVNSSMFDVVVFR